MSRTLRTIVCLTLAVVFIPTASADARKRPAHRAQACAAAYVMPAYATLDQVRSATLCLLNGQRAQRGLRALRPNGRLAASAVGHSRDMVDRDYFSHDTPNGVSFVDRIIGHGYATMNQPWTLGENLAWGTDSLATPAKIVDAWMHSPGHRVNILSRNFREIGVGIVPKAPSSSSQGATYTTDFGAKG